jgi:Flp pilus assembly protein TadG
VRTSGRRARDERGIATATTAIVMGVVILTLAGIVQAALYFHGVQRAEAAADRAVASAAAEGSTAAAGEAAGREFLASAPIDDAAVVVRRNGEQTTATVTGVAPRLIPIAWHIVARAHAPTEVFRPETERR